MTETGYLPKQSRSKPPLRLDSPAMVRRSLELSPSRSSLQSSRAHTPSSSVPSTPLSSARAPSPEKRPLHPADSSAFLTALAAQERHVLELREELHKAEADLLHLKKQWVSHEATKKRDESRCLEQLQPLKTSLGGHTASCDDNSHISINELDRRKMAPPTTKPSTRTVFSGSRHARALSLLSPRHSVSDRPLLSRNPEPTKRHSELAKNPTMSTPIEELSTLTDGINDSNELAGPPKDMILETGKQIVGDFRQGLWTFFEDLKQVTVGDEAAGSSDLRNQRGFPAIGSSKTQARRESSSATKMSPAAKSQSSDTRGLGDSRQLESFQNCQRSGKPAERRSGEPSETPIDHHRSSSQTVISTDSDDDDGWDNWDDTKGSTPRRHTNASIADPIPSYKTEQNSPRTIARSNDSTPRAKRLSSSIADQDHIPCPALTRMSPGRLAKSASTLMSDWERSLAS